MGEVRQVGVTVLSHSVRVRMCMWVYECVLDDEDPGPAIV